MGEYPELIPFTAAYISNLIHGYKTHKVFIKKSKMLT